MFARPTIHTAFLICCAFIFKILFVNVSLITSLKNSNTNRLASSHFSSVLKKRRRSVEDAPRVQADLYSFAEYCEEDRDGDDEDQTRDQPLILSFIQALLNPVASSSGAGPPFDSIKGSLYPSKYLAFSILRI
jgi:hypothetical protein